METKNEVIINGVVYIPKVNNNSSLKIVVLQRGWNVIGRIEEDGDLYILTNAYVIRRWGTETGLGQLALEGKQSETILDKVGTTKFHKLTTIQIINCDESKWDI